MCKRQSFKFCLAVFLLFLASFSLNAECFHNEENGFTINFVESFYVSEKSELSWYFESDILPVEVAVNIYKKGRFSSSRDAIQFAAKQVNSTSSQIDSVNYRGYDCSISSVSFALGEIPCSGWILSIKLKDSKILNVLGFTGEVGNPIYESIILSILDSVCVDHGSFYSAGPVTCYAYPKEGLLKRNVEFEGFKAGVTFDKSDADANSYLILREYSILALLSSTDYWFSAWQRFYQMVYRDSYGRIKDACFNFCSGLYAKYADSENPEILFSSAVLRFMQNLPYGRSKTENDFTNLVSTFLGTQSDCDSRSLLCAIFLDMMDIKSTLFVSVDYSHALVGAKLDSQGAKLLVGDTWYLLGETTAKVDFGKVAQSMSDSSKWLNITPSFVR